MHLKSGNKYRWPERSQAHSGLTLGSPDFAALLQSRLDCSASRRNPAFVWRRVARPLPVRLRIFGRIYATFAINGRSIANENFFGGDYLFLFGCDPPCFARCSTKMGRCKLGVTRAVLGPSGPAAETTAFLRQDRRGRCRAACRKAPPGRDRDSPAMPATWQCRRASR